MPASSSPGIDGTVSQSLGLGEPMFGEVVGAALVNLTLMVGIPLFGYWLATRRKMTGAERWDRLGLRWGSARFLYYSVAFAALVVVLLAVFPPSLETALQEGSTFRRFAGLPLGTAFVVAIIYGVVTTGLCEEFLFRGLLTGVLARRMPAAAANGIQALLFASIHLLFVPLSIRAILVTTPILVGALFAGWIRISSGSMVGPWIIHAVANIASALMVAIRTAT